MIQKIHHAEFYEPLLLVETGQQNRHCLMAEFQLGNRSIVVGTLHLQSIFFRSSATTVKCHQLNQVLGTMKDINGVASYFILGDMNLTSDHQLKTENKCIEKLGLIDVWKNLHETTEDENDPNYQRNDITWDGRNNTKVKYVEFHRPDRIFISNNAKLTPISIKRLVNNFSDHYGLVANFSY